MALQDIIFIRGAVKMRFLKMAGKWMSRTSPLGLVLAGTAVVAVAPTLKSMVHGAAVTATRTVLAVAESGTNMASEVKAGWEDIVAEAKVKNAMSIADQMPGTDVGTVVGAGAGGAVGASIGSGMAGPMGAVVGGGLGGVMGAGMGSGVTETKTPKSESTKEDTTEQPHDKKELHGKENNKH